MKRVVIEIPIPTGRKISSQENAMSMEALHMLQHRKDEYAGIFRIVFPKNRTSKNLLRHGEFSKFKVMYKEKEGEIVAYVEGRQSEFMKKIIDPVARTSGVYCLDNFAVYGGSLRITFIGKGTNVARFLKKLATEEVPHKLLSLIDARFSSDSSLYVLTAKQREVLINAFKLGYFKVPRRITSEQLAKNLGLSNSAVSERLRNAEQRLLSHALGE